MPRTRTTLALLLAGLGLAAAACNRGEEPDAAQTPVMDTTNSDPLDGVPTQVLVDSAEGIAPEVAAQRGLIRDTVDDDTTSTGDPGRDMVPGAPSPDPSTSRAPSETQGTTAFPPPPGMPPESAGIRVPRP